MTPTPTSSDARFVDYSFDALLERHRLEQHEEIQQRAILGDADLLPFVLALARMDAQALIKGSY